MRDHLTRELAEVARVELLRAVAESRLGVLRHLHDDAVGADGRRGARNMQNYALLEIVGKLGKPVLLKRGLSSTLEELLMAADYILKEGNERVMLCERGIRTFETATRSANPAKSRA